MPTATSVSQVLISNVGPLTTVFTAPPACATASSTLWLGISTDLFPDRVAPWFRQDCGTTKLGECYPSGKQLDEEYESAESAGRSGLATVTYFSPASACPDAHKTVGVAYRGEDGKVTSSGIFVPPVVGPPISRPVLQRTQNPPLNVLMQALDQSETAVICCPQDYTVAVQGLGCYSPIPWSVYGETTGCLRYRTAKDFTHVTATFTYNDTAVTGLVMSITASNPSFSTEITTVKVGDDGVVTETFHPFAAKPAYTLIHGGATQAANATKNLGTAAFGGGVGFLATVWAFAALAGVALALPL